MVTLQTKVLFLNWKLTLDCLSCICYRSSIYEWLLDNLKNNNIRTHYSKMLLWRNPSCKLQQFSDATLHFYANIVPCSQIIFSLPTDVIPSCKQCRTEAESGIVVILWLVWEIHLLYCQQHLTVQCSTEVLIHMLCATLFERHSFGNISIRNYLLSL